MQWIIKLPGCCEHGTIEVEIKPRNSKMTDPLTSLNDNFFLQEVMMLLRHSNLLKFMAECFNG